VASILILVLSKVVIDQEGRSLEQQRDASRTDPGLATGMSEKGNEGERCGLKEGYGFRSP